MPLDPPHRLWPDAVLSHRSFVELCDALETDSATPVHRNAQRPYAINCVMRRFRDYVLRHTNETFPVPRASFDATFANFLEDSPFQAYWVGLDPSTFNRIAWLRIRVQSQFSPSGGQLIADPAKVDEYIGQWEAFTSVHMASALSDHGFVTCPSWPNQRLQVPPILSVQSAAADCLPRLAAARLRLLRSLRAWIRSHLWQRVAIDGVLRVVVYTPAFCMLSCFLFLRDIVTCLATMYTAAVSIISITGVLFLAGVRLGPVEGLALSVFIGVSVDYVVHFAFAYKHSLIPRRYYKSRAAVFARLTSTASAAATTIISVAPPMFASLIPLRTFSTLFLAVVSISFLFALGFFLPLLMVVGPLTTSATMETAEALEAVAAAAAAQEQASEAAYVAGDGTVEDGEDTAK